MSDAPVILDHVPLPAWIIVDANRICDFMTQQGFKDWCVAGIASRDYLERLKKEHEDFRSNVFKLTTAASIQHVKDKAH